MRKTIKTAAVVAAMSALTIASASVAFAAVDERTNLSSLGKDAVGDAAAVGEWNGNNVDGWTFTVDGEKLSGIWAQIDGAWYYFHKDGIMAQDELVYLEGETYYFHPDGRMQAEGWIKMDGDCDQIYEYGLNIEEYVGDVENPVIDWDDLYEDVWMYFNADGTAVDDEWFSDPVSDLHYYFDDIIMVAADYDHNVNGTTYGFGADGHMFVGWEQNYEDLMMTAPNKDAKTWYYYNKNGKKFDANDNGGYAWKEIDGKWYCFEAEAPSVGTLIVDAYFENTDVGTGNDAYYYVDKKGVMQTGVVSLPKDIAFVTGAGFDVIYDAQGKLKASNKTKATEIYLGSDGKAKTDSWSGTSYYAKANPQNVWTFKSNTDGVTAYSADAKFLPAHLVKEAFVYKDDMYRIDKYGDKVVNSAILVGYVEVTSQGAINFYPGEEKSSSELEYNAYVIADKKGIVAESKDVDDRTVKVGAKTYTPVLEGNDASLTLEVGSYKLQVYYYANEN